MTITVLTGNNMDILPTLPDQSVHTCVTSPPYFGLRDYGTATWDGGDPNCDHKIPANEHDPKRGTSDASTSHTLRFNRTHCHKCGAIRIDEQLGLEATPEEYVSNMVKVFREVKRVLRDDGTLWLNIGDSYASMQRSGRKESPNVGAKQEMPPIRTKLKWGSGGGTNFWWRIPTENYGDIKPKDLIGIPWMLAFALRADGWYLRQDIIWHKPNPMPESVEDRCTKAHEYIFLLSKSSKYYFDYEVIKEPVANSTKERLSQPTLNEQIGSNRVPFKTNGNMKAVGSIETRNKRSVWTVTTKPFKGAHFATFPPDLIEPCILAGCPENGTVLDPFGGSGTTGVVAKKHKRNAIMIELNPSYVEIIHNRIGVPVQDGLPI